jgi:hypothetical protein
MVAERAMKTVGTKQTKATVNADSPSVAFVASVAGTGMGARLTPTLPG